MLSCFSHIRLFLTPWTIVCQGPLSVGFSRQEYWSGLPCAPVGDLQNSGIKPGSPALQAYSLPSEPPGKPLTLIRAMEMNRHSRVWGLQVGHLKVSGKAPLPARPVTEGIWEAFLLFRPQRCQWEFPRPLKTTLGNGKKKKVVYGYFVSSSNIYFLKS